MSLSESFKDLDPKIAGPLQRVTEALREEIRAQVDDVRKKIGKLSPPAAAQPPAKTEVEGGLDPLAELKHAVAGIDGSASQAAILTSLLEGVGRFSSRAAFMLIRDDGMRCWGSLGFEDARRPLQGQTVTTPAGSAWAQITDGAGARALSAEECAQFCDQFEAAAPEMGALLPMSLGERVAACLYADRLSDESLNLDALQLLTLVAGQTLETLPMRHRSFTPTLRVASTAVEAPEAPPEPQEPEAEAVVAEPEQEPEAEVEAVVAEPEVEAEAVEVEPEPAVEEPEPTPPAPIEPATPEQVDTAVEPPAEVETLETPPLEPVEAAPPEVAPPAEPEPPVEMAPPVEPPAPVEVTPPVEPEPTEPEPTEPAEQAPPPARFEPPPVTEVKPPEAPQPPPPAADRSSTQVVPPDDVLGPGWAFTTKEVSTDAGNEALQEEARRLARLLVTEIKLYNEEQVEQGRRSGDIYRRLREDIDRSRQIFDDRIDDQIRAESDYFRDALVRILAGGDESLLGM